MLWEKKTQLMKETRLVVEEGHGDIQITKDDIHRMEVRELVLLKNVYECCSLHLGSDSLENLNRYIIMT